MKANKKAWAQAERSCLPKNVFTTQRSGRTSGTPSLTYVFQDIQSQNDFAIMQLNMIWYNGDSLRAQFRPNKIRERQAAATLVTVAQT